MVNRKVKTPVSLTITKKCWWFPTLPMEFLTFKISVHMTDPTKFFEHNLSLFRLHPFCREHRSSTIIRVRIVRGRETSYTPSPRKLLSEEDTGSRDVLVPRDFKQEWVEVDRVPPVGERKTLQRTLTLNKRKGRGGQMSLSSRRTSWRREWSYVYWGFR